MDLIDRLRNFEVSDDLGNGDFSLLREAAAEIVALRAEREVICAEAVKYADKSGRLEAKVDRLAEAGRRVTEAFRAHGEASSFTRQAERTRHECEAAMLSLDDALARCNGGAA